jgi:DNA-directed RNA polymerase specialized sigma24 family protein
MQAMPNIAFSTSVNNNNVSRNQDKSYFYTMPENAELQKLLREDEQLFMETLFKTCFSFVCKTIYRIVQDTATAEDLAQDVFIKIWNRREALKDVYFKAYLHRAAINMALDHIDKHKTPGYTCTIGRSPGAYTSSFFQHCTETNYPAYPTSH